MLLKNKVAIITGAAKGIGAETAKIFSKEGAKVVICDLSLDSLSNTKESIESEGREVLPLKVNVTNKSEVGKMVEEVLTHFGRIDILVNNAGITQDALFSTMKEEQFDSVVSVNLKGTFLCAQAVIKTMSKQRSGVILNASSIVGLYGNIGQTNYAATKFGVIGMTKTWAKELGRKNIRVNAIAPGFIKTPMTDAVPEKVLEGALSKTPLGRLGEAADVANAYLFLASDLSNFISGTVLSVDGGLVL